MLPFEPAHIPVLMEETIAALAPRDFGHYLDGTLGLGGHTEAILSRSRECVVCGLDRDATALAIARTRLAGFADRLKLFHLPFAEFPQALDQLGWKSVDGALLDLGISSFQLDNPERGFGFRENGLLDMRMDLASDAPDARALLNGADFARLRDILAEYGEEPLAARIARRIVDTRKNGPIEDTATLAALVSSAYPAQWRGKSRRHPATRVFQALRIAVNDELGQLAIFLRLIFAWLAIGGKLVVITFHSLEDRLVKRAMRDWARALNPAGEPVARLLHKKPLVPDALEIESNPRARSAKLRAIEKLSDLTA